MDSLWHGHAHWLSVLTVITVQNGIFNTLYTECHRHNYCHHHYPPHFHKHCHHDIAITIGVTITIITISTFFFDVISFSLVTHSDIWTISTFLKLVYFPFLVTHLEYLIFRTITTIFIASCLLCSSSSASVPSVVSIPPFHPAPNHNSQTSYIPDGGGQEEEDKTRFRGPDEYSWPWG